MYAIQRVPSLFLFLSFDDRNKGTRLEWKKIPGLPDIFFSLCIFFILPSRREERDLLELDWSGAGGYQKHFIVSVRARHIRGLPLADALSRRHVCFSVVKRAAGRQTGLNQPPPLSVSPLLLPILSSAATTRPSPVLFRAPRPGRMHRSVRESVRPGNKLLFV